MMMMTAAISGKWLAAAVLERQAMPALSQEGERAPQAMTLPGKNERVTEVSQEGRRVVEGAAAKASKSQGTVALDKGDRLLFPITSHKPCRPRISAVNRC